MLELLAATEGNGRALTVVLLDYRADERGSGDPECDIMVYTNHQTKDRECVASESFLDFGAALAHCRDVYGINTAAYRPAPKHQYCFKFDYGVTNIGTPQPHPLDLEQGDLAFGLSKTEIHRADNSVDVKPHIRITGSPAGLRNFAAWILLCAESEQYDDYFHVHFEDFPNIHTKVGVRLCGPNYMKSIEKFLAD